MLLGCGHIFVNDVFADVAFDDLSHQPVHRAATRRDGLQDEKGVAVVLLLQQALDPIELATNAAHSIEQLLLFVDGVRTIPSNNVPPYVIRKKKR